MSEVFDHAYSKPALLFGEMPTPELIKALDSYLPAGRVLELGAGDGRDTIAMLRRGYNVVAVEISKAATAKLRSSANRLGLRKRLQTVTLDVRNFQFPIDEFDAVVAVTLLDHLNRSEGRQTARRLIGAARPGGLVFLQVLTTADPAVTGRGVVSEFASEIRHYFGPNELLRLAASSVRITLYEDRMEWDHDHGAPHQHGMAVLVGLKR